MGASSSSSLLRPEEVFVLAQETHYEPKEIKTLYKRFRRLDLGQRGTLGDDDLLRIPEVIMNPLAPRLLAVFDRNADGRIDFRAFTRALSLFNERSSPEVKLDALFRLFDVTGSGVIEMKDMLELLRMLVGDFVSSAAMEEICNQTLAVADNDSDGVISCTDFENCMASFPWHTFYVPVCSNARNQYFNERDGK